MKSKKGHEGDGRSTPAHRAPELDVERRLREALELLDAMGRMARVGGWELNLETEEVRWTRMTYAIHEVDEDFEPTLENAVRFYSGPYRTIIEECVRRAREESLPYDEELEFETAKGRRLWVRTNGEPEFRDGRCVRLKGTIQDITERKRRENALEESERRLNNAQSIARLGDWSFDLSTGQIAWSPQVFELFERAPEQGPPDLAENLAYYSASSAARLQEQVRRAAERGEESDEVYELHLPSGARVYHHGIIRPRLDADGRVAELLGTVQDVTEATRIRRRLDIMQRIVDSSPVILFLWRNEPGLPLEYASSNVERILGYSFEELLGGKTTFHDLIHPDDRQQVLHRLRQLAHAAPGVSERPPPYRVRTRDGQTLWMDDRTCPRCDSAGRISHLEGILVDVTARREAELARARSEAAYRQIVETTRDGIWIVDTDGATTFVNDQMAAMLGCSVETVRAGRMEDFTDAEAAEEVERLMMRRRRGISEVVEIPFRRTSDGSILHTLVSSDPIRSDEGEFVGALAVVTDITERQRSIDERRSTEEMLRQAQKLESLGLLAGGVAHDFNNILMGVLGNAELAIEELPPDAPVRGLLEGIRESANRAADLSRQMLAYSGRGGLSVDRFELNRLLEELRPVLEASVGRSAHLDFDLAGTELPLDGDSTQISQVVLNLLINASEALEEAPGEIRVRTTRRRLGARELRDDTSAQFLPAGEYVVIQIEDTGCGMDETTRLRIFDPFFSTKFTGRGLGLAASAGILRGHRGGARVRSTPGHGSTFELFLPAAEGPAESCGSPKPESEAPPLTGCVLLVDDEATVREIGGRMLEMLGLQVAKASDGIEGLERFREAPDRYDLVILDLTMPRLSGRETLEAMRAIRPEVPVLLTSGYAADQILQGFEGRGLSGFLQKPFRLRQLRGALREILEAPGGD